MSGGADSSILCYMLSQYKAQERPDIEIFPITAIKNSNAYQFEIAHQVVSFCEKHFDIKFRPHTVLGRGKNAKEMSHIQKILRNHMYGNKIIQCHVMGVTANPPLDVCKAFEQQNPKGRRDPERDPADKLFPEIVDDSSFRPFANVDKKVIAELYQYFGLTNSLFPMTKSCEADSPTWDSPHCGGSRCWFCLERQWGFGRLI